MGLTVERQGWKDRVQETNLRTPGANLGRTKERPWGKVDCEVPALYPSRTECAGWETSAIEIRCYIQWQTHQLAAHWKSYSRRGSNAGAQSTRPSMPVILSRLPQDHRIRGLNPSLSTQNGCPNPSTSSSAGCFVTASSSTYFATVSSHTSSPKIPSPNAFTLSALAYSSLSSK